MNIAFISNFQKTYLFSMIAKGLSEMGYGIYWICFQKKYYDFLLENNSKNNILLLNRDVAKVVGEPVGEYKLNELVYNDRALGNERDWGL